MVMMGHQKMDNHNKKLTLKEMARCLRVSTATVSNAFNRPDQLSAGLRQRILDECRRQGYAGPRGGRRQLNARPTVLGLILAEDLASSLQDEQTQAVIRGLAKELDRHHANLLLLPCLGAGWNLAPQDHLMDGFIIYRAAAFCSEEQKQALVGGRRVVALECNLAGYPSVQVDHYGGAGLAVEHALRRPVNAVSILGLHLLQSERVCRVREQEVAAGNDPRVQLKLRGYLDALEARGMGRAQERIWHVPDTSMAAQVQAVREALSCYPRPDLLLCMDDSIALAALGVAAEKGLNVPGDLQIVGCAVTEQHTQSSGALTTLLPPCAEQQGRMAGRMFFGDIADTKRVLPMRLSIGASCP